MISRILVMALVLSAAPAFADSSPGVCGLHFKVSIDSTLFWQEGSGSGRLSCTDASGVETLNRPVEISISGVGFGIGHFDYEGVSGNVGILDARDIEGTYEVLDANAGLGIGLGLSLDFYNQKNGLSFGGKVKAGTGIGVAINGSEWTIKLRR